MANEISSMVQAKMPAPAKNSGQFVQLEAANVPDTRGQALPIDGQKLPQQQVSSQSADQSQLREAVSQINSYVQTVQRDLSFSLDEGSGRTIIKVVDSESGKLVRQIPSEEVLALATYLQDMKKEGAGSDTVPSGILFSDRT
jgi:flagellar protein FlaG